MPKGPAWWAAGGTLQSLAGQASLPVAPGRWSGGVCSYVWEVEAKMGEPMTPPNLDHILPSGPVSCCITCKFIF